MSYWCVRYPEGLEHVCFPGLRNIRFAVCSETEDTDEFSEANVKRLIGEAFITSRALYSDYVTFATTQLVSHRYLMLAEPYLLSAES